MAIEGSKKERIELENDFVKRVGLFEAKVIAVNPTIEEFKEVLGRTIGEDSKAAEYLGTSKDGNAFLRVDFHIENVKSKDAEKPERFKVTFFLENKERENKDGTKKQYINSVGTTTWAADENDLADWFTSRDYRVAYFGEEDFYNFMRTWLGELDYRSAETTLQLEWKKLMKGNVKDLKDQVGGEWCTNIATLATISVKQKDGETKEYQSIYTKGFLPAYALRNFRLVDYGNDKTVSGLRAKKFRDLKPHERFVVDITGEYGCKDYYILKDIQDYNSDDNLVASDKVISEDGADF